MTTSMPIKPLIVLCLLGYGCTDDRMEQEHKRRLQQIEADGAAILNDLDDIQARLLVGQSRVSYWTDAAIWHRHLRTITDTKQRRGENNSALIAIKDNKWR